MKEANFGILPAQLFVLVDVSLRARGGVEKRQPAGATSIMSHAQEQGSTARRHVVARLIAQFDVRTLDTTERAASTYPNSTSTEECPTALR
jgi:hypothetical protein